MITPGILCDDVSEHVEKVDDEGTGFVDSSSRKGTFSTCQSIKELCRERQMAILVKN